MDGNAVWGWLILAVVLAAAEILAPGVYLMWIAFAALATAGVAALFPYSLAIQATAFTIAALVSLAIARSLARRAGASDDAGVALNRPDAMVIGQVGRVVVPIGDVPGRVLLSGTEWGATGVCADVGDAVTVVALQSNVLIVTKVPPAVARDPEPCPNPARTLPEPCPNPARTLKAWGRQSGTLQDGGRTITGFDAATGGC